MKNQNLVTVLDGQPVLPVLVIERLADAVPLAMALMRGGLPAIEVTLRTPDALDAIRLIADEAPEVIVGAGTVRKRGAVSGGCGGRLALHRQSRRSRRELDRRGQYQPYALPAGCGHAEPRPWR